MRLLLIEDHKPLVRALRQGLGEEGFAVDVAYDGEEGDYKARTANYDVIILDLMLPREDGLQDFVHVTGSRGGQPGADDTVVTAVLDSVKVTR